MNKTQADKLWNDLNAAFTQFEDALVKIVAERAWEPLGYATFADAWADRMQGFRLGTDAMKAAVAYQLIAEKLTDEQIIAVAGLSSTTVERLRTQRRKGVPAKFASTRVRAHDRLVPPSPPRFLHLKFTPEQRKSFDKIAAECGLSVERIAYDAVLNAFKGLAK